MSDWNNNNYKLNENTKCRSSQTRRGKLRQNQTLSSRIFIAEHVIFCAKKRGRSNSIQNLYRAAEHKV